MKNKRLKSKRNRLIFHKKSNKNNKCLLNNWERSFYQQNMDQPN